MAILAHGFSAFQLGELGSAEILSQVERFLNECLKKALKYESNGARARLHYFRGIIHEANYEMRNATQAYDRSLQFCIARATKKLANPTTTDYESERSFAIYCLGKMELRLAQLDFDSGRLNSAKRHANEAGLLLRASRDPFLPIMADILRLKIGRYEEGFLKTGWRLVKEFDQSAATLRENIPYSLEASIEAIKTSVYLLHFECEPPDEQVGHRSFSQALKDIEAIIERATKNRHQRIAFDALLVKARILNRIQDFARAHDALRRAEGIVAPLPKPLASEVFFVRGKIHSSSVQTASLALAALAREKALEFFLAAHTAGHSSLTFQISCKLQIAEMHLLLGHGSDAERFLGEATDLARGVEHTFLNKRLEELARQVRMNSFSRHFSKKFDIQKERAQLEKDYLLYLSRSSGYAIEDFPKNFKELHDVFLPPGFTYERMMTLLKRHFRVARERNPRPKPPDAAGAAAG